MATVALIGGTGMVGSHILTNLNTSSAVERIYSISRRIPQASTSDSQAKVTTFISDNTETWPGQLSSLTPPPKIFVSAFGTTKSNAGSFESQHKIEHGLNLEMARAARDAGTTVYVLISSGGADRTSSMGYARMKGEIEDDVKALAFNQTVILRPGLITGTRDESRPFEASLRFIARWAGKLHPSLKDGWAQDSDAIARAAVYAGLKALAGDVPEGSDNVWTLNGSQIIELAKDAGGSGRYAS